MRRMKYIVIDGTLGTNPYIFPESENHAEFAQAVGHGEVIGAGFVTFDKLNGVCCYGDSVSLGVKSREEDSKLVARMLGATE